MFDDMDMEAPRRKRLTRVEAKARTRQLLLDAAAQTFARKGFAGASVEEIAESAGFSIGALYSNFANKEELFLELAATYNSDRVAKAANAVLESEAGDEDPVNEVGRILIDAADKNSEFALLQAEFWLYAVRNPKVLDTIAERMREPRQALERLVATVLEGMRTPPEADARSVATVVAAVFDGLIRQRRLDPESVSEDLFGLVMRWLFAGIDADGAARPPRKGRARSASKAPTSTRGAR